MMKGIVASGQSLQAGQVVALDENGELVPATPGGPDPIGVADVVSGSEARVLRQGRAKDLKRGTPGLSALSDEKKEELRQKLEKAKGVFKLSINLQGDEDDV